MDMSKKNFEFKNYPIVFIGSGISKRYLENVGRAIKRVLENNKSHK
jgi:hypothetical protein